MTALESAYTSVCIPIDGLPEPADSAPNPEALAIRSQRLERLRELFYHLLGARDAAVFISLYLEDMTAAQSAQRFELTLDQVDYIRRKALQRLRADPTVASLIR